MKQELEKFKSQFSKSLNNRDDMEVNLNPSTKSQLLLEKKESAKNLMLDFKAQ